MKQRRPVLGVDADRRTRPRAAVEGEVDPRVEAGQRHLVPRVGAGELGLAGGRVA